MRVQIGVGVLSLMIPSLLAGCGSDLNLAPVSGVVTYQGKPLANATVTFIPRGEGSLGVAVTGEDGSYEIQTAGESGVAPGPCAVTVSKMESSGKGQEELDKMSEADRQKMMMSGKMPKSLSNTPRSAIPAQYSNAMTSGLSFEVKNGSNTFAIDLK